MKKFLNSFFVLVVLPASVFASGELTVKWDASEGANVVSWTLPHVQLNGTYQYHSVDIYRTFGYSSGVDSWTLVNAGVTDGSFTDYCGYGSFSYELRNVLQYNYDSTNDLWYTSSAFPDYGPVASYFMSDGSNSRDISITDAAGGQESYGGKWKISYSLQETCYIDVRIYKPGTKFIMDSEGFYSRPASTWCVKSIVDYKDINSAPRPAGSNYEEWDCTDSSGNIVGNGIYYVMFEIFDPFNPPSDPLNPIYNATTGVYEKRDAWVGVIPIDILRIKNFSATGINQTNTTSSISYDINNAAEIKVLILYSGKEFAIASSSGTISYGSSSAYNYKAGDLIPASGSGSDIVTVISYYRQAGKNTETWNGQTSEGGAVSNGLYPVGICARDSSGNTAIATDGNDQPFFATITVDKRTETTTAEGNPPALVSVSPSSGTTVSSVNQITVSLSDASGVNAAATTVSLQFGTMTYSDGNGATQSPTSGSSTSQTFTLMLSTPMTTEGSYTIKIVATDVYNNSTTYTVSFNISSSVSASGDFAATVFARPQPSKSGSITFLADQSGTFFSGTPNLSVCVYTIYGEKVYENTATGKTLTWNYSSLGLAPGVYIYRMKAWNGSSSYEAVKKAVIYK